MNNCHCCVFLDIAKAFNTAYHKPVLEKLECYGFRSISHKLFSSYFLDRLQSVKIGNIISETRFVGCLKEMT